MLATIIKIAFRSLFRQRIYSFVIILSLAIGFSLSNLLFVFLNQELRTDSFHRKKARIFRLLSDNPMGKKGKISFITEKASNYLEDNYPEIEALCKVSAIENAVLINERMAKEELMILGVDPDFFEIFSFPVLYGNKEGSFKPGSIIISRKTAELLFGQERVVGRDILIRQHNVEKYLTITTVIDDFEGQSHLKFDALIHYKEFDNPAWGTTDYVLLNDKTDPQTLESKVSLDGNTPSLLGDGAATYFLQPLMSVYFDQSNTRPYSIAGDQMFIWIGWTVSSLILLIAGFNFINLFLLQLMKRKKEIGIKKVLGASGVSLRNTIITEVFIYVLLSYSLSLLFTLLLLPEFNNSLNITIEFSQFSNTDVITVYGTIIFLLSTVVVIYLTKKLDRLSPIRVITGAGDSKVRFNMVLLQLQFVISIVLTICAIGIIMQIGYIKNKPLGYSRNLLEITAQDSVTRARLPILKQRLLTINGINKVALSNGNPLGSWKARYDLDNDEFYTPYTFKGDEDLINTFGLQVIQGDYNNQKGGIVNKTLIKNFNISNPIGEAIPGSNEKIVAVVRDFNVGSFKNKIPDVIITIDNNDPSLDRILVNYSQTQLAEVLPEVAKVWSALFPDSPFEYNMIEDELLKVHADDLYFLKIIVYFAIISIMISSFGLFSLSWAITQNRTKEIGIRKVLGASVADIFRMLTYDYAKRIALAFIIALPIAYLLMSEWLQSFVYRIKLSPTIFLLGGVVILLISLVTVSIHTVKSAFLHPVDELRNE